MNKQTDFHKIATQEECTPNYQLGWMSMAAKRFIASMVSLLLIYQPLLLQAADLNADQAAAAANRPTIGAAGNGVPLVNIAAPTSSGLSHNKYEHFNVDQQGLILNNAAQNFTQTQLGGFIQGNPNLRSSGSASVILNEVTSSNRSALNGYVEVAGTRADVIIANPNGITCKGCGFINTPNATLTTGRPDLSTGTLHLDVTGGDIQIDEGVDDDGIGTGIGINANNLDKLSIITKAARLNAEVHAKQLEIITGSNVVDMQSGQVTGHGASGTGVSIDSSALGGMYADRISLVGSDSGVGVNIQGEVISGIGGFDLTADGKVVMNNHTSSGRTSIESRSDDVELKGDGYARERLEIKAAGKVAAEGLNASANEVAIAAAELVNSGEIIGGADEDGSLRDAGGVKVNIGGELNNSGEIKGIDVTTIAAGVLDNSGRISSKQDLAIVASNSIDNSGVIKAGRDLSISAAVEEVATDTKPAVLSNLDIVNDGLIAAAQDLTIISSTLENSQTLFSGRDMYLYVADLLHNRGGADIYSMGNLKLAKNSANDKTKKIWNESGTIQALESAEVYAEELLNTREDFETEEDVISSETWRVTPQTVQVYRDDMIAEAIGSLEADGVSYIVTEELVAERYCKNNQNAMWCFGNNSATRFVRPDGSYLYPVDANATTGSILNPVPVKDDYILDYTMVSSSGGVGSCPGITGNRCGTYTVTYRDPDILDSEIDALLEAKKEPYIYRGLEPTSCLLGLLIFPGCGDAGWRLVTTRTTRIDNSGSFGVDDVIKVTQLARPYYTINFGVAGLKHNERRRYLTDTVTEERVVKESVPGEFIIGGDLTINADSTTNYLGLMAANGDITITGNEVNNKGQELHRFKHRSGRYEYCYKECHDLFHNPDYTWAPLPTISTSEVIGVAAYSTIQAVGSVDIQATEVTNSASAKKSADAPIGLEASSDVGGGDAHASLESLAGEVSFTLPTGDFGLFVTNSNPDHPYLVETNPEFANFGRFLNSISSSFMIGQLSWDPDAILKRLGDDAYENKLIRDQIFAKSGRRYIDGNSSDYEQYKYLMENGLAASQALELTPGVALTQEQINRLTLPIVWLEQQEVQGHQVLVPKVYLTNMDRTNYRGGQIAGTDINIQSVSLTNSGSMDAEEILQLASIGDINNLGGSLHSDGVVDISANDTFNNISGSVSGDQVDISANQVNIVTAVTERKTTHAPGQTETEGMLHDRASVTSKSGTTIVGLEGVNITGARVATESGDTTIGSLGNVIVTSAKKQDQHDFNIEGGYNRGQVLTNTGSEIEGDNVQISSGDSILLEGSNITADEQIELQAENSIVIASIQDRKSQDDYLETKGMFGAKNIQSTQKSSSLVGSTGLKANNVNISARELTLVGSKIEAETARITAEALTLISDKNSEYESHFSDTSGLMTRTIESKGFQHETAVASTITAAKIIFNQPDPELGGVDNSAAMRDLQEQLITQLSSEHNLTQEQITTVRATLQNREWHDKTTTLSAMGAVIVRVISMVIAPQLSALLGSLTNGVMEGVMEGVMSGVMDKVMAAAIDSLASQFTSQLLTVAFTGDSSNFDMEGLLKGAVQAGVTAGIGIKAQGIIDNAELGYLGTTMATTVSDAAIHTAVFGGSFEDNLIDAAIAQIGQQGADYIGDKLPAGELSNIISHAALGCALGKAKSGDCSAGAAGAALSAAMAPYVKEAIDNGDGILSDQEKREIKAVSQLTASLVAGLAGKDIETAFYTATNEVENNYLSHAEARARAEALYALEHCASTPSAPQCSPENIQRFQNIVDELNYLDKSRDDFIRECSGSRSLLPGCIAANAHLQATFEEYRELAQSGKLIGDPSIISELSDTVFLAGEFEQYLEDPDGYIWKKRQIIERVQLVTLTTAAVGTGIMSTEIAAACYLNLLFCSELAIALAGDVYVTSGGGRVDPRKAAKLAEELLVVVNKAKASGGAKVLSMEEMFGGVGSRGSISSGLLPTELSKAIRSYGNEVQQITGYRLVGVQSNKIKNALQIADYSQPLSAQAKAAHRAKFDSAKSRLILEWEANTGRTWPTYGSNAPKGRVPGGKWDAHELIPNKNGGPIEWWNITPARYPDQHQGGIHAADSAFNNLMQQVGR